MSVRLFGHASAPARLRAGRQINCRTLTTAFRNQSKSSLRPTASLRSATSALRSSTTGQTMKSFASSSRVCSAPYPPSSEHTISHEEYEEISEEDMDKLHENLEVLCEAYGPDDWEVEYSSGVMTLTLPPHGIYVINKQPPNLQIWMSSPLSGPSRFEYVDGKWTHHRKSEVTLGTLLEEELRVLLDRQGVERAAKEWEGTGLV